MSLAQRSGLMIWHPVTYGVHGVSQRDSLFEGGGASTRLTFGLMARHIIFFLGRRGLRTRVFFATGESCYLYRLDKNIITQRVG